MDFIKLKNEKVKIVESNRISKKDPSDYFISFKCSWIPNNLILIFFFENSNKNFTSPFYFHLFEASFKQLSPLAKEVKRKKII